MTNAEVSPLMLTDEIREAVNNAFENRTPVVVAYVAEDGQPSLSFRGTTQVWSNDQLAIWARSEEGGLPTAIAQRPKVTLWYRDPATRMTLQFRGRAHRVDDPDVREKVYTRAPAAEQAADPDRKGIVLIIDLDRVDGRTPAGPIAMRRDA
jgi:hypothetical protein